MKPQLTFKVGDLVTIINVVARDHQPRVRVAGLKRPWTTRKKVDYVKDGKSPYIQQFGIITEAHHFNSFWKGMETGPNDNVYICYMQETGEYLILCENEIELAG